MTSLTCNIQNVKSRDKIEIACGWEIGGMK